jgi:hypothetical protein
VGGPLNIGPESVDAYKPSLRLDSEGNPLVAWSAKEGDERIAVRRWGPSGWQALGPTTVAPGTAWGLELAGGTPILLSQRYVDFLHAVLEVRRWTGSTWESLGAPLGEQRAVAPQVRADAAGNLFLAWLEEPTQEPYISRLRVARWSGTAWEALGPDVAVSDDTYSPGVPALELDAEGRPLVAWSHASQTGQSLRVARWTGQDWNVKAVAESPIPGSNGWYTIGFHPDEGVVVAWTPHESEKLRVLRMQP